MYYHLPPLNGIKAFDAAARLGSFKKAAEELHVTPTAISHQIKTLEDSLGTLLFIRKTRAIQLTKHGELLAETSYSVLQQLANVVNDISSVRNVITISTTSSFAAMWLVPNLNKFHKLHPNIEVVINTGEQIDDVEKDKRIDLAIRYGVYESSVKSSELLITEDIGMYATANYIASINSLADVCLLETEWQNKDFTEISWSALLEGRTDIPELYKTQKFDQEHHIIQAALAGQGIALVSSLLVQNAIKQGWLVDYNFTKNIKKIKGFSYYLVIPKHNVHSKSIMTFKNWIIDELM
jgi:LysR family glycine cleavage system transcriptional activator